MTNKREECLRKANEIVNGEREGQYGSPENNFQVIADLWNAYLTDEVYLSSVDVAMMMSLLKIARIRTGTHKEDSFLDLAGYAACAYEIAGRDAEKLFDCASRPVTD